MCCIDNEDATLKVQQRKHTFAAYKVIEVPQSEYGSASQVVSLYGMKSWGSGIQHGHVRNEGYDARRPHGIHFYFLKKDAIDAIMNGWVPVKRFMMVVQVNPKDVIASEKPEPDINQQGVALKVTVTKHAWNDLLRRIRKAIPKFHP